MLYILKGTFKFQMLYKYLHIQASAETIPAKRRPAARVSTVSPRRGASQPATIEGGKESTHIKNSPYKK